MAANHLPLDLSISPSLTMQNMLHPACLGCPVPAAPSDLDPTQLSPPWDWIVKPGPYDKHAFSAHRKPQLQHSWRYILSIACFLAPLQTHNEWSRSPQPGATPSTLFTLLPFTHSSCSSPNEAGPSY